MPIFPAEEDTKIKNYADTIWSNTDNYPWPKFAATRSAKSFVKNGPILYHDLVSRMRTEGLPLIIPLEEEEKNLHTKRFWAPLGIKCDLIQVDGVQIVKLDKASETGSLPVFLERSRDHSKIVKQNQKSIENARCEVIKLTEQYNKAILNLLGDAAVDQYTSPGFKFLDHIEAPTTYSRKFVKDELKIDCETHQTGVDFHPYIRRW